jgi:hypothetical protein
MARSTEPVSTTTALESDVATRSGIALAIYSKGVLGAGFTQLMEQRLAAALRRFGSRVERLTVRFEDLNGPKGGVDTACRIQLSLSGEPPLVVEGRDQDEARAFRVALPKLVAALDRKLSRRSAHTRVSVRTPFARAS